MALNGRLESKGESSRWYFCTSGCNEVGVKRGVKVVAVSARVVVSVLYQQVPVSTSAGIKMQ